MTSWICAPCGLYFAAPAEPEAAPDCPQCGRAAASAGPETDCAEERSAACPVADVTPVDVVHRRVLEIGGGIVTGLLLGGTFVGLESLFVWGLRAVADIGWAYYPLQVVHVAFVAVWCFVNVSGILRPG